MQTVVLTLFGESYVPEPVVPRKNKIAASEKKVTKDAPVMSILQDWQPEKQYYSIGEIAELFSLRTSNVRFWTQEFSMKLRTNKKGDRLFTAEHIQELRLIYHLLRERGYTLAGAKIKLREERKKIKYRINLRDSLLKLRKQLITIREELKDS